MSIPDAPLMYPSASASLPPPTWDRSDEHFFRHGIWVLARTSKAVFLRYVLCRGNKVLYLRRLGVSIGSDCDILTSIQHFGTEPWLIALGSRVTVTEGVL